MDSKRNLTKASRRKFLTTGAAAAALGAVRTATAAKHRLPKQGR